MDLPEQLCPLSTVIDRVFAIDDICYEMKEKNYFLHWSLIPSVLIILVLSFLERPVNRTRSGDQIPLLNKRFGLVIPLDLLRTYDNRWTFGFAFGAMANVIISLFSEDYLLPGFPSWAIALNLLLGAFEVGLLFYPLFACLTTDSQIFGSVAGFLYTLAWFIVTIFETVLCPHGMVLGNYENAILNWPTLLCLTFVLGSFVHQFIKSIRTFWKGAVRNENSFLKIHQAEHVKRLFQKPQQVQRSWFQRKIYTWDPCFKFPSRMICTTVLALICLYIFAMVEYPIGIFLFKMLNCGLALSFPNSTLTILEFDSNLVGVWYATTFISTAVTLTYVFHILACYRKHMKRLWVGDKSFLPKKYKNPPSALSLAGITRYCGWQVAYLLWGYSVMHIVQSLFAMAFIYAIVVPLQGDQALPYLRDLGITILTFLLFKLLMIIQPMLAGRFFLQTKISPLDKEKPLALNNSKGFHNFSYFFFFYNVIIGLGFCLYRLLSGLFLGSFLIARIDRSIIQSGYEVADLGYKTWIGMIFVDHYHTNPALVSFCYILLTANEENIPNGGGRYSFLNKAKGPRVSVKARTRWLLWYTLLKNPRLIVLRKRRDVDGTDNTITQSRLFQASLLEIGSNQSNPANEHNVDRKRLISISE